MAFRLQLTLAILAGASNIALLQAADPPGGAAAPSTVENAVKESDLPKLKLTPEAEKRLGIEMQVVEKKPMPQSRLFAGLVILPLPSSADNAVSLAPAPPATPEDYRRLAEQQGDADGKLAEARATLEAAQIALSRAREMRKENAGSQRVVDEATAAERLASAAFTSAENRRALLGTPVMELLKSDRRWLAVSVFSGDLSSLDTKAPASVTLLGATSAQAVSATPVRAPPSASTAAGTVDLFYEVPAAGLRPGQRVQVRVPLLGAASPSLVAPRGAVLYDAQGGTWVYEQVAPQTFARRRVWVRRVTDGEAVLDRGVVPGTKVVRTGVAELFGAEFGIGK